MEYSENDKREIVASHVKSNERRKQMGTIFIILVICYFIPAEALGNIIAISILCLLLALLVYLPVIGLFVVVGITYCVIHLSKEYTKQADKKIRDIKKSRVVFIGSRKLYVVPLHASATEVIVLHPTFSEKYEPTVNLEEIKCSLSDVSLANKSSKNLDFYTIDQISSIAKDLHLNIEPQKKDLESKLSELKRLEKLAMFSELYKQQADLYSRATLQVKELLDHSKKLSQECHSFMIDILIGQELAKYNTDNFPDILIVRMSLDSRCKQVSDQYKLLKSEMDEYMELKNELSESNVISPTNSH